MVLIILKQYIEIPDTDSLKLYVEGKDVYDIRGIEDIIDTSNFSKNTDKPLIPGKIKKTLGALKFEKGDKPMSRLISPASKSSVEIFPDDSISFTLKGCKKGNKKDISANDTKDFINKENQFEVKQTRIISERLDMKKIEDTKYVLKNIRNKREAYYGLNKTIQYGYKAKYLQALLKLFRNNRIPSRKEVHEVLNIYPARYFHFDYLEQYWEFKKNNNFLNYNNDK